ncbi:MAG: 16S rRNA (cytidine(1402)-2'-O)-methyltransferase [Rhodocyclaceae bacterium]|nr:16S rRNA (cytidine(1402)-2'-O)-methyltransferase [Rhodocyclaceae bacterium]
MKLFIVATPIGNLGDITVRALEILRAVDWIACEDTRHSRRLLDHYGIQTACFALHEHNEREATARLMTYLTCGQQVALISDAGTPGISDPGARAVAVVRAAGFPVVPIPGPNAAMAAWSASGLSDERFLFVGFLPAKAVARRKELDQLAGLPAALVFYESPHRVAQTVLDMVATLDASREIVMARELTKCFEEIVRCPLSQAVDWLSENEHRQRGEFVLIVSGPTQDREGDGQADRVLNLLLEEGLPVKQAAKLAANITGAAKNDLYQKALEFKHAINT